MNACPCWVFPNLYLYLTCSKGFATTGRWKSNACTCYWCCAIFWNRFVNNRFGSTCVSEAWDFLFGDYCLEICYLCDIIYMNFYYFLWGILARNEAPVVGLQLLVSVYWNMSLSSASLLEMFSISLTESCLSVSAFGVFCKMHSLLFIWLIRVCFVGLLLVSLELFLNVFCNSSVTELQSF